MARGNKALGSLGATASVSVLQSGSPANLMDENGGTECEWRFDNGTPRAQWVQINLDQIYYIDSVIITWYSDPSPLYWMVNWDLQDATSSGGPWTTLQSFTTTHGNTPETYTLTTPASARYWRLFRTDTGSAGPGSYTNADAYSIELWGDVPPHGRSFGVIV